MRNESYQQWTDLIRQRWYLSMDNHRLFHRQVGKISVYTSRTIHDRATRRSGQICNRNYAYFAYYRSPRAADLFINVENGPHWIRCYTGYQISEKAANGYSY